MKEFCQICVELGDQKILNRLERLLNEQISVKRPGVNINTEGTILKGH